MSTSNVQFIVPLQHFAEYLQMAMERIGVKRNVPFLKTRLSNAQAYPIVYAMFKRNLEERMHWVAGDGRAWWDAVEVAMKEHIPDWMSESEHRPVLKKGQEIDAESESIIDYFDAIYTDVVDPLWLMMDNMIGQQMGVPDSTWDMYTLELRNSYLIENTFIEEEVWVPARVQTIAINKDNVQDIRTVEVSSPVDGTVVKTSKPTTKHVLDRIDLKVGNAGDFRVYEWERNIKSGHWKTKSKESMEVHAIAPDSTYREANRGALADIRRAGKTGGIQTLGK